MAHYDELYPGRFLKGKTLMHPITVRIVALGGEELEGDDGAKYKAVLKYHTAGPDGKPVAGEMVFAKSNAMLAEAIFGTSDYKRWVGHLITIGYNPDIVLGNEKVGGLRIVGSPELKKTITVDVKRPRRKKPDRYMLQPTDGQGRPRVADRDAKPGNMPPADAPPPNEEPPPDGYRPDME